MTDNHQSYGPSDYELCTDTEEYDQEDLSDCEQGDLERREAVASLLDFSEKKEPKKD